MSENNIKPRDDDVIAAAYKSFVARFVLIVTLLSSPWLVFFVMGDRTPPLPWIGGCNASGYSSNLYIAYCNGKFAGYDHWAILNNSERGIHDAVKSADVVFLGNSRALFGFSTDAVSNFFKKLRVSHYVLAFNFAEGEYFAERIFSKLKLRPSLVVINADSFFVGRAGASSVAKYVLQGTVTARYSYSLKKYQQRAHAYLCTGTPSWLMRTTGFCGIKETLYRSRVDGHFNTNWFPRRGHYPITYLTAKNLVKKLDTAESVANEFFARTKIARDCVILTVVPTTDTDLEFVTQLSSRLGIGSLSVDVGPLYTMDKSHLTYDSAERWSNMLMAKLKPYFQRCVLNRPAS